MGGPWECSAIMRIEDSMLWKSLNAGTMPSATGEKERPCADEGGPMTAWLSAMFLQQSWPGCPCDRQRIELQHFMACSGVVIPTQSDAYAPTATVSTATRTLFPKAIRTRVKVSGAGVKVGVGDGRSFLRPRRTAWSTTSVLRKNRWSGR